MINFSESILFPLSDLLQSTSISESFWFLQRSQYWDEETLNEYQNARLKELLKFAAQNVPFYKNGFWEIKLPFSDLRKLII